MDDSNHNNSSSSSIPQLPVRRGTVRSDSVAQLQVEIQLLTHAPTPHAPLAVPSHWRKEDNAVVMPPCEIVFDSSSLSCFLWDDDDMRSCTDDSVSGSFSQLSSSSSCSSSTVQDQQPHHHVVPSITTAQLTAQLQVISNNPSPCRVQGICQHWQALCRQDESFAFTLLEHGAMEVLLDAMVLQKDFSQVQQAACWVLAELFVQGSSEQQELVQEWFGECGGMEAVLGGMALFPDHAGVQQAACAALQSWTWNHRASQELLVSKVDTIRAAMKNHPTHAGVQQEACAVLLNLVETGDLAGGQLLESVLSAMECHGDDQDIQEVAGTLLLQLLPIDDDCTRAERLVRILLDRHSSLQDLGNEILGKLLPTTIPPTDTSYQYLTPPLMERKSITAMESPTEVKAIFHIPCLPSQNE